jgi:SYP5 family syntaxin
MGATVADTWMREFEDAMRLADEIMSKIQEASDLARAGEDASRTVSSTRRTITRLNAKADRLDTLLKEGPEKAGM